MAPDLLGAFATQPSNDGPDRIVAPAPPPAAAEVSRVAAKPPNDLQQSLTSAAAILPTVGANISAHIQRLLDAPPVAPKHDSVEMAATAVGSHVAAFLGLHS